MLLVMAAVTLMVRVIVMAIVIDEDVEDYLRHLHYFFPIVPVLIEDKPIAGRALSKPKQEPIRPAALWKALHDRR